jgi:hypothetical protein
LDLIVCCLRIHNKQYSMVKIVRYNGMEKCAEKQIKQSLCCRKVPWRAEIMSENNGLSEDGKPRLGSRRKEQGAGEPWHDGVRFPLMLGRMPIPMWHSVFIAFLLAGMCSNAEPVDHRDFAIDTYYPRPNEVRLAEERARRYWANNASRYGSHPVYLAVETSKLFESEIMQNLYAKLINSETTTSFFARSAGKHGDVDLKGIMIFDIRTGHFVSARGYVSVDTPQRGRVARFGAYIARYIGTGRGSYSGYSASGAHYFGTPSYAPSAKQRAMAQKRVQSYFAAVREGRRPAASSRYIAVETLRPTRESLAANLNKRAAARMAQPSARMAELERLHWLMVFDTQTQQFVGSGVYTIENLPAVSGPLMTFDTMTAEFVGEGSL